MSVFANSEDQDECCISSGSALFVIVKKSSDERIHF